jgi:hypothetical protein
LIECRLDGSRESFLARVDGPNRVVMVVGRAQQRDG